MPFKWKNDANVFSMNMRRVTRSFPGNVDMAVMKEGEIEMTEAKRRTPVWNPARKVPPGHTPGSLRASGRVTLVHEGAYSRTILSFGGDEYSVDYAIYVHEDLEAFHATGQAKFLESVLNESSSSIAGRLAADLNLDKLVLP